MVNKAYHKSRMWNINEFVGGVAAIGSGSVWLMSERERLTAPRAF